MTLKELQDGKVFLIDKPLGWTSFQVVNKLKWSILKHFNIKKIKIGHCGTLDPLATGLLIICTGRNTKIIPQIQDQIKEYSGEFKIGAQTPSYDLETEITSIHNTDNIFEIDILNCAKSFIGVGQLQTPPIYSAIKKDGKRAYNLAREGKEIKLEPRKIDIFDFQIKKFEKEIISFNIICGKGTYIRSIAHDFGKKLNNGAYLKSLRREKIGNYNIKNAFSIEKFIANITNN